MSKKTDRETDAPTNGLVSRQKLCQPANQANELGQPSELANQPTNQPDRQTDRKTDRQKDKQTDWLTGATMCVLWVEI